METKTAPSVSDEELQRLTSIYQQLAASRRSLLIMGSNLLLASQEAEAAANNPAPSRTG